MGLSLTFFSCKFLRMHIVCLGTIIHRLAFTYIYISHIYICFYFKKHVKELYSFTANTHTHISNCSIISGCGCMCHCTYVGVKGQLQGVSFLPLSLFRFQDRTQTAGLPWRVLHPLSHLSGPVCTLYSL